MTTLPTVHPEPWEMHLGAMRAAEKGALTILDVLDNLPWVTHDPTVDWTPWRAFLAAVYGLPMTDRELSIYRACTGRMRPPTQKVDEAWLIVGRRGKKSAIASLIAVWEAALRDHSAALGPGERAMVPIMAKDKDDATTVKAFITTILKEAMFSQVLQKEPTGESLELSTRVDIKVRAVSLTSGRSRVIPCAVCDEIAFWHVRESTRPDRDVLRGIRPAMATVKKPLLVCLSSPYAKAGVLWEAYSDHYGHEGDPILVWRAPTLVMHDTPKLREYVAAELAKDPVGAAAEYLAEFREDIGPFIRPEIVDAAVRSLDRIPYDIEHPKRCWAFVDPSLGSSDSMTLGIAWREDEEELTQVYVGEWEPPARADPGWTDTVIDEMVTILRSYKVNTVWGDMVGGLWLQSPFARKGITYVLSEFNKSEIYRGILPRLNAGHVALLDNKVQTKQIKELERRSGGSTTGDKIDHPPGGHDDVCFVAGTMVATTRGSVPIEQIVVGDDVLVPGGTSPVVQCAYTGIADVIRNGPLVGTPEHPVFTMDGFVRLDSTTEDEWEKLSLSGLIRWASLRAWYSVEYSTDSWGPSDITSASLLGRRNGNTPRVYMSLCWKLLLEGQYRKVMTLITSITARSTTTLATWSRYRLASIVEGPGRSWLRRLRQRISESSRTAATPGIRHRQDCVGIDSTLGRPDSASGETGVSASAPFALVSSRREASTERTVPSGAERPGTREGPTRYGVPIASKFSSPSGAPQRVAPNRARGLSIGRRGVYNLSTVAGVYYANGVLVHNCNAGLGSLHLADVYGRAYDNVDPPKPPPTNTQDVFRQMTQAAIRKETTQPGRGSVRPVSARTVYRRRRD